MYFFSHHRKIKDAKARAGCASLTPDVLMKVLSGSVAVSLSQFTLPCPVQHKISQIELSLNNLYLSLFVRVFL